MNVFGVGHVNVYLDTMIFLHCSPFEQIDFCDLLGEKSVTLVIPRITLRELDKHKGTHSSSKIRERARKVLSKIEQLTRSSSQVREGVGIRYVPSLPQIDFEKHGLNPDWNDDLLIASVLGQSESVPAVLISHDTNVRLTCTHLGIRAIELPDNHRLPEDLDERDEEIRKLKRDLLKLQNSQPSLSVTFVESDDTKLRVKVSRPIPVSETDVSLAVEKAKKQYPKNPNINTNQPILVQQMQPLGTITDEERKRYYLECDQYYVKIAQYQRQLFELENLRRRTICFSIRIANLGSTPAEDVDLIMQFPNELQMYVENQRLDQPTEPEPPTRPKTKLDVLFKTEPLAARPMFFVHNPFDSPISSFSLTQTNQFTDHCERIKHGSAFYLPKLYVVFNTHDCAHSFHCDYELRVANMTDPTIGQLHFVLERDIG